MGTCRFCLGVADMSIFFEDRKVTLDNFLNYTKFKIQKNDGLPGYVCLQCIQTLEMVVEFMQKCDQSDKALRCKSIDDKKSNKATISNNDLMSDLISFNVDDDYVEPEALRVDSKDDLEDEDNDAMSAGDGDSTDCFGDSNKTDMIQIVMEKDFFDMSGHLCNICGEQFSYGHQSQFARHLLTHSEPQFKCDECPKAFYVKSSYNTHKKSHSATKQFPCEYCDKKFYTKGRAFYHMEYIHRKTKSYACEFCDKVFYRPDYFKKHISIVHKKKQVYQCRSCNETFPYVELLRAHMVIHNGEKTYTCRFCEIKFTVERELKEHETNHIGDNPYKCDVCSQNFGEKKHLKAHVQSEHNIPYLSAIDGIGGDFLQL